MNEVALSGYIQSDQVILRHTPKEVPVTSFLLKVRRDSKDCSAAGASQYDYLTIVCWRSMAEYASKHYAPGMLVEVYGSIRTGSRSPKGYKIFKENGDTHEDLFIPRFEIYARRVVIL